jgi:hypothetical protein
MIRFARFFPVLFIAFFLLASCARDVSVKDYLEMPVWEKEKAAMDELVACVSLDDPEAIKTSLAKVASLAAELKATIEPVKVGKDLLALHKAQLALCDALGAVGTAWDIGNPEKGMEALKAVDLAFSAMQASLQPIAASLPN